MVWSIAFAVACLLVLVGVLYQPRHGRPGVAVLLVALHLGATAVVAALARSEVSAGLGLGLFGALAIIRLRSTELEIEDVAYVFAALVLGLVGGFELDPPWLSFVLMVTLVIGIVVVDSPLVIVPSRRATVRLDGAFSEGDELLARVEEVVGHAVESIEIRRIDLVDDTTTVVVTSRVSGRTTGRA